MIPVNKMLIFLLFFLATVCPAAETQRLIMPPEGRFYHGVYPGGRSGAEDDLTAADLAAYEKAAGRPAAWVYFSHNWFRDRRFPTATVNWIRRSGAIPYIRLMLRSSSQENRREPLFTLVNIADGDFDEDLAAWGRAAAAIDGPLLVEWGTECNGSWFPWNGSWNYDDTKSEGPRRFVAAYRHIIHTIRRAGARNLQWVFHANSHDVPEGKWNRFEAYYPGDSWIDLLAVSIYGPKTPGDGDGELHPFTEQMDAIYPRLQQLAPEKPLLIAEFGCTAGHAKMAADQWVAEAFQALFAGRWPHVVGFSWWNERWDNGHGKADTTMRLQDTPALAARFRDALTKAGENILDRPHLETVKGD
jgi:hypothetical protein